MFSKIVASGKYLPKKILTNYDLEKKVNTTNEWIVTRTGIEQRHIAAENEAASDLAYLSIKDMIDTYDIDINTIDAIVVATSTPDLTFPSTATIVQAKLQMKRGFAFDIQAVCSGFVYALQVADSMICAGRAKKIIVVGAEVFSKILDWNDRNTCVLFGDGAGAMLLEATNEDPKLEKNSGILGIEIFSDGAYVDFLKTTGGPSTTATTGCVLMNGTEVFKHAVVKLSSVAELILKKYGIDQNAIDCLVPHQANIRIIKAMAKKLNLDMQKVIVTIDKHANTSAASIPLAFNEGISQNKIKKGDLILMESMGAGFTWGASIIRY